MHTVLRVGHLPKLLVAVLVGALGGCAGSATSDGDDGAAEEDLLAGPCDGAGGVCTSTVFVAPSANPCGTDTAIDKSCGDGTFRVCCPVSPAMARGSKEPVDLSMPDDVLQVFAQSRMLDHHMGWHMSRTWDGVRQVDRTILENLGYPRAKHQEGDVENGLEFLAMHRSVLQYLRKHSDLAAEHALFDGWIRVPDPLDRDVALVGPDSLAQNPPGPRAQPLSDELRETIALCQDNTRGLSRFSTDDEFGRFIQTSLQQDDDPGAGLHNFLHTRFSQPGTPNDLADPHKNLKHRIFWRLHGWLDRCWTTYRTVTGKKDDDPRYIVAMAKGESEMHLPAATP